MAMGTWAYMAPEQRTNAKIADAPADVYATGATRFALLTGREPNDLFASAQHERIFAGIPAPLVAVLTRATRFYPDDRFATAADMMVGVRSALAELHPDAVPMPRSKLANLAVGAPVLSDTVVPVRGDTFTLEAPEVTKPGTRGPARLLVGAAIVGLFGALAVWRFGGVEVEPA